MNFCTFLATKTRGLLGSVPDGNASHIVLVNKTKHGQIVVSDPARDLMARQGVQFDSNTNTFATATETEIAQMKKDDLPQNAESFF